MTTTEETVRCIVPREYVERARAGYAWDIRHNWNIAESMAAVRDLTEILGGFRVGDYVHVAPGARIGGEVTIGDRALIGIGAIVLPGLSIGHDAVVGAGAVVTRDVAPYTTVVGTPAAPLVRRARVNLAGSVVSR